MRHSEISLSAMTEIQPGQGKCFIVENREIAIFRRRSGKLVAIENHCPHCNAPLCDGVIDEDHVTCPYQAHSLDFATLPAFVIFIREGRVFLSL